MPTKELIAWFATKGSGTNEALRLQTLLAGLSNVVELPFEKGSKLESAKRLWSEIRRLKPDLLVMEGTGIAGGIVCLFSRWLQGIPYVFSSGDAVGPYVASHAPLVGWLFALYERLLCRCCAGFIGWTPYLVGRALTLGAPRAMTAAGWVIGSERRKAARTEVRSKCGVPQDHLVVGLVGNLQWNTNKHCCYGWDLVQAVKRARREDLSVLIVGDGSGLLKLKEAAGELLDRRVFLPGPVPLDEVMNVLSAMDVASLPQSMDGVGMFRYTTKFPEYAAAGLPIVTNQTPAAYDLGGDWIWRIRGAAPWDAVYLDALVAWMNEVSREDIRTKSAAVPRSIVDFNRQDQVLRTKNFIEDIFGASGKA